MASSQPFISDNEIATRAYEIWQARGCPESDGSDDWEAARADILASRIARNGSTQTRMQTCWQRMREKLSPQI